ncbi:hypothetical protein ACFT9M_00225 [Micromonospora purpureochromogenes]|uniref:hypothetical protein n=1 Tax=Micromonospora purpureochromogenes TaxID=47872 RepID=UPI003645F225
MPDTVDDEAAAALARANSLPKPRARAAAAGDRTFRCLAGRGADQLCGPTLGG